MKRIIVIGVGAQGSTIAKRMNDHPGVSEIICADYDFKAAQVLAESLDKASALKLDARDVNNVVAASRGCALIVNGLPLDYNLILMDDRLTFIGLDQIEPGKPVQVRILHADGSEDEIIAQHSMNEDQIAWFLAGSALNLIRSGGVGAA